MKRVVVVGAGFVGTATGTVMQEHGHSVVYVDVNDDKINNLTKQGQEAVFPEELRLRNGDFVFVSVPTPSGPDGELLFDYLEQAANSLGVKLRELFDANQEARPLPRVTIIFRSTMLPGSTRRLIGIIEKVSGLRVDRDFSVAYMPEYLRERHAVTDFRNPRMILIGCSTGDRTIRHMLFELFDGFEDVDVKLRFTNSYELAELQKYIHNDWNAVKIAFFNQFRLIAEWLGLDQEGVEEMIRFTIQTAEASWNPNYGALPLGAYDGHCLPKDMAAMVHLMRARGFPAYLLEGAEAVNRQISESTTPSNQSED